MFADWDSGMLTNVPGIYAVGDANSDEVTNVPHAIFSGKRAAVFCHGELLLLCRVSPPTVIWY